MKSKEELAFFEAQEKKYMAGFPQPVKQAQPPDREKLDPVIFAVVKARIDGIIREMARTIIATSRNPILHSAKDFTCSILSYDGFLFTMADTIPSQIGCLHSSLWGVLEAFKGDIHPGDVFINNDPYHGNNHAGDFTMHAPIFFEGEVVAWATATCHLIDIGGHTPASADPLAADVYEDGYYFPGVRICRNHQEIPEIVRFIKTNFRYSEQWHGDFLAQVGSLWTGEQRMIELCRKYGGDVIKQFQDEYLDYADRRMTEVVKKLPRGEWSIESLSETFDPMCPEGVLLKVTMWIEPEEAMIYFDLTDMPDNLPFGLNTSWATARTSCIWPSLATLDSTLPLNDGVYRHIKIYLREGALVGMPKYPVGTSMATTGMSDETTNMVFNLWEKVGPGLGHGGGCEVGPTVTILAGVDFRQDNKPFGHLPFLGGGGGPSSRGCDGWPVWVSNGAGGNLLLEQAEIVEQKVPVIVWEVGAIPDSGGAGQWRGGVVISQRLQPRHNTIRQTLRGTGYTSAALGVAGGKPGALARHWVEKHATGEKVRELYKMGSNILEQDEDWVCNSQGGGGYGDPLDRDREAVKDDVRDGLVSLAAAHDEYGVVLDTASELYEVDVEATKKRRSQLMEKKGG